MLVSFCITKQIYSNAHNVFCQGQIEWNCRTRHFVATNRVEAWGRVIKTGHFLVGWGAHEPRQIVFVYRSLADKTFWDLALSDNARQSCRTSWQVKIFCRPTQNRLVYGGLKETKSVKQTTLPYVYLTMTPPTMSKHGLLLSLIFVWKYSLWVSFFFLPPEYGKMRERLGNEVALRHHH